MDYRLASPRELETILGFGAEHIPDHYEPLLGAAAARAQVDNWWTRERMSTAIDEGRVVVAEMEGVIVGVAEWSLYEGIPTIWKLYVHPSHRGEGVGPHLVEAAINHFPNEADRVRVETFEINARARVFYEREGFRQLGKVANTDPRLNVVWLERPLD